MLISETRFKTAIMEKFGSQAKFARALGVAEGQVTRGIRTQTPKFLAKCKTAGLEVDRLVAEQRVEDQEIKEKRSTQDRIKELERLVEYQGNLIKSYELILQSKIENLRTETQK